MKCKVCNFVGKSLVSHITRKHKMSIDDYKLKYNVDRVQEMSQKQREYLSNLWKDRFTQTKWIDKYKDVRDSIWNVDYWIGKGYTLADAKSKISEIQRNNSKKRDYETSPSTLTIKYWLSRGYTNDESKLIISDIQRKLSNTSTKFTGKTHTNESKLRISNTMRNHIDNIGKTKWTKHFDMSDVKYRSQNEVEIFNYITDELNYDAIANEFISDYNVDILVGNKIIEYFGIYWHAHKLLFEVDDIHPTIQKTAGEIREYDFNKIKMLQELGYEVLVIWENDYTDNKKNVMNIIKKYLYDKNS